MQLNRCSISAEGRRWLTVEENRDNDIVKDMGKRANDGKG